MVRSIYKIDKAKQAPESIPQQNVTALDSHLESLNAGLIQTLQSEVKKLKKQTKLISFLTENAVNHARSKSISNVTVEPDKQDYVESLTQLLSEKIVTQMHDELK